MGDRRFVLLLVLVLVIEAGTAVPRSADLRSGAKMLLSRNAPCRRPALQFPGRRGEEEKARSADRAPQRGVTIQQSSSVAMDMKGSGQGAAGILPAVQISDWSAGKMPAAL